MLYWRLCPHPFSYIPSRIRFPDLFIDFIFISLSPSLQSPTGSGKSLAILCSVLAWHRHKFPNNNKRPHIKIGDLPDHPSTQSDYKITSEGVSDELDKFKFDSITNGRNATGFGATDPLQFQKSPKSPPKIIFTSRTHSQLQQLIAEYRRTAYFQHFQMAVLGSRKSLCINHKIKDLSDRNDKWYHILFVFTAFNRLKLIETHKTSEYE